MKNAARMERMKSTAFSVVVRCVGSGGDRREGTGWEWWW
jgi:hypothetical protein